MAASNFSVTSYLVGDGSLERLRAYAGEKVALVVDDAIIKALHLDRVLYQDIFTGSDYTVLCSVPTEPTMAMLNEPIHAARSFLPSRIIGIGGGSVMDAAKAIWLFRELPSLTWDEALIPYSVPKFPGTSKLTVVPTTSGTGSETTGCAVFKDGQNRKRLILSREIIPSEAILDYSLLQSLPQKNIAYSGADALAHALESAISSRSNAVVRMVACQAAVTILKHLSASYQGDLAARERVHAAASMAGMGIGNAGTGMAHGMDQAGGDFHLPHGLVTGLILPYTMRYLMPQPIYTEVAEQLGFKGTDLEKQDKLIKRIFNLYKEIGIPKTLMDAGISEAEYIQRIPTYVEHAIVDAGISNCPKSPSRDELTDLYKEFYNGI